MHAIKALSAAGKHQGSHRPEDGRSRHLDHLCDGRGCVIATCSNIVEEQHPVLKVGDLILVREAVISRHEVDSAQRRVDD